MKNGLNLTIVLALAISTVLFFSPEPGYARVVADSVFEEVYESGSVSMTLEGTGIKSFLFLKAFVAGFYKEGAVPVENNLGEFPKRIEVKYFVSIPSAKLLAFTIESMEDNVGRRFIETSKDKINQMGEYFVDLEAGDRFALTYIPGIGTKFEHNDTLTGVIEGKDFAEALFSTWIGKRPFDEKLKKQILGANHKSDNPKRVALQKQNNDY